MYFTKLIQDHKIPTNIDINERLWTGRFGANGTSLTFICRNRFLYLGTTVKLWTYWMYFTIKFFSVSFFIDQKKTTVMKSFSMYFGHHSLAILNSFLNILNKYNVLILIKYMGAEGRGSRNTNTISYLLLNHNRICYWISVLLCVKDGFNLFYLLDTTFLYPFSL